MNRKEEFEALLASIADAPVILAGGSQAHGGGDERIDDAIVLQELRAARERQKDPDLFSGDPDGVFTYDDPVLAITAYLYHAHRQMTSVLGIAGRRGEDLRNDVYWKWARTAVYIWHSRSSKSYATLMGRASGEAIKIDKDVVRLAVVGDAGFDGQAQATVLYSIRERHRVAPFDLLIHLGDVYFAGQGDEFLRHLVAPFRKVGPRVRTLVGNHDLYFGADGFLGALDALRQPSRYFSIENPHWRVACLDTALYAETLRRNYGLLDDGQLRWLDEQLEAGDNKSTILMSHHYIISGWGKSSNDLKSQLDTRLDKIFAWYWGHEHCCATYDKKDVGFYGACVGNGAFLEPRTAPSRTPHPSWQAEGKCSCYREQSNYWPHGYLEIELRPKEVVENYHLEGGESYRRVLEK